MLKNLLNQSSKPVVVPRSHQNAYHVVGGSTGIDRAINYINYAPANQYQQQFLQQ